MTPRLRFGRYAVEALLGPGGVTETYRARPADGAGGKTFALKLLRADRAGEQYEEVRRAFVTAAERWARTRVPGLLPVVEVQDEAAATFVVTELVEGRDAGALASEAAKLPAGERAALVALLGVEIARVLSAAHGASPPLVHGGLVPGDVLVDGHGAVRIADFGLSAALRDLTETDAAPWRFVAPELLAGQAPTARADLYGLGAVLFLLFTGRPPLEGERRSEIAAAALAGAPPVDEVPRPLQEILAALLARDPADRPESAGAAGRSLSGVAAPGVTLPEMLARLPSTPPPRAPSALPRAGGSAVLTPRRRSRRWPALATGAFAGALALAGVVVRFSRPPPRPAEVPIAAATPAEGTRLGASEIPPGMDPREQIPPPGAPPRRKLPRVPNHLAIDSTPPGALVWVDGRERGTTPADLVLGPGGHRVVLVLPGHRTWKEVVDTTLGEIVKPTLQPVTPPPAATSAIAVDCRTRGKYPISIDDRETGLVCPAARVPVVPGLRRIGIFVPAERRIVATEVEVPPSGPAPAVRFKE